MRTKLAVVAVAAGLALTLGWSGMAVAAQYPPNGPAIGTNTSILGPGGSLIVTGNGFLPFEFITLFLHSTPVELGTVTADSTGSFSTPETIPPGTPLGAHTIVAIGASGDSATTAITLTSATTPIAVVSASPSLPFTGADIAAVSGVGAVALAVGGTLILTGRRRRRTTA
jgi:hypothetical protein